MISKSQPHIFRPLRTICTLFGITYFFDAYCFARYADISIAEILTLDLLTCRVPFDTYTITPQKHFLKRHGKEHNAYVGIDKECRNSLQITTLQHDFSTSSLSVLVTATKSVACGGMGTKVWVRGGEGIIMPHSYWNPKFKSLSIPTYALCSLPCRFKKCFCGVIV